MTVALKEKLRQLRSRYSAEGFNIIGISGSYARDEETVQSDLDLIYEISNPKLFAEQNGGFGAFSKILQIKKEIEKEMLVAVDLIALSSLNDVGQKYIMRDMQRVG